MLKRLLIALVVALLPTQGWSQATVLQGGSWASGHTTYYSSSGGSQPIIQSAPGAGGGPQSISEMSIVKRGSGAAPYAGGGGGFLGSTFCLYDSPPTNSTGGHQLCFDANATGGMGLLSYNAFGGASALPLTFNINGSSYPFPAVLSGVVGPGTTVVNDPACWNNTTGTLLKDCTFPNNSPGGSPGQIQYNNAGAFGGFTMAGDCTLTQPNITCTKVNGQTLSLGGTLTTGGAVTFSGAGPVTITAAGSTGVTLPLSGTLATLAGTEALTNKTVNGLSITSTTGTLNVVSGKTLRANNTLTFAGTDASTLNIGTGGTLGTAAFTASSAYVPSATQQTASLSSNINMADTGAYYDGPTIAAATSGTYFASGTVTLNGNASDQIFCKLWDGATIMASGALSTVTTLNRLTMSLSGFIANPAGSVRISCKNTTSSSGTAILFNASGNSLDSTINISRVQ